MFSPLCNTLGVQPSWRTADWSNVKRALVPLFAVLATVVIASASPASAGVQQDTDYGLTCVLTVTPPQVTAGSQATVAGTGFQPNFATQVLLDGNAVLADVVTDNLGAFSISVTIPAATPPGARIISAICDGTNGAVAQTSVTVLGATQASTTSTTLRPPGATTPTTLRAAGAAAATATTGTDIGPQLTAGIAILGAGAAFVLISRRRNRTVTP